MKYYEPNEELLNKEKARLDKEAEQMGLNAPVLYCKNGVTTLRILPPYSEVGAFYHHVFLHRIKVGGDTKIVPCPSQNDLACPICDKGEQLYSTHDETLLKQAKDLRPRENYIYNVLCYSGPPDGRGKLPEFGKVYVLQGGVMIHRQIMALDRDEATSWADITNLTNGVTITITRTGKGQYDTKYNVLPTPRSNIWTDLQVRSIDPNSLELYTLDQVYTVPSHEEILALAERIQFMPSGPAPVGGSFPIAGVPVHGPAPVPSPVPAAVPVASPPTAVAPPPAPVTIVQLPAPVATPVPAPVAAAPAPVPAPVAQAPVAASAPVVEPAPATVPLTPPTAQPAAPVQAEVPQAPVIPPPPPAEV